MPITQDRMIALVNVATEFYDLVQDHKNAIADAVKRARMGADVRGEIELLASFTATMQPSLTAIQALAMERAHFNAMATHNDRARQYMANQRAQGEKARERFPRASSVRHRVKDYMQEMGAGAGDIPLANAPGAFAGKTRAEIEAILVMQNIRKDEEERHAKAAAEANKAAERANAPRIDPTIPIHENPELFREHDAEAVEIKDIWDKEGSIVE